MGRGPTVCARSLCIAPTVEGRVGDDVGVTTDVVGAFLTMVRGV